MAMWEQMALDNLAAAQELLSRKRARSSVSRSYYAAYSIVTDRLNKAGVAFANDRQGPGHGQLTRMVEMNMPNLTKWQRRQLKKVLRTMYIARCIADYDPDVVVGVEAAREMRIHAMAVFSLAGVST